MYRNNVVLGMCVVGLFMVTLGQQAEHDKLLSIEEVEAVTGIEGIKLVPRNPQIGAGGELNFALAGESMVLMVGIQDAPMYNEWKTQEGFFNLQAGGEPFLSQAQLREVARAIISRL